DGKEHHYGFELVFFQSLRSDLPPIYNAHFAISDLSRQEFHYDQRSLTEPNAIIPNGSSTTGFVVSINNWSVRGLNGHDQLQATMDNYTIKLDLSALKSPTLHNGNGLITYGLGGFSYYYSRTRMAVSGTLQDHQQSLQVSGTAWMDHQWGDFLTLGSSGWDWYSIQLDNRSELMLYVIRDSSNRIISTYVGYIKSDGESLQLPSTSLRNHTLGSWTSPVTGITYPSGWQVEINDTHLSATLTLRPQLKDQELVVTQSTGNIYWEGSVDISGQSNSQAITGQGYVELTGYRK
ncbi:MAG TPA: lipocalin family protein, partial [Ktedonobacteraceae bacterium]|nr:lipocalin family protein [Ktedonobacteraceae bacterium]